MEREKAPDGQWLGLEAKLQCLSPIVSAAMKLETVINHLLKPSNYGI